MITVGPVVIPIALILIVIGSLACGYLVYFGWRFFSPSRGQHRDGAPPLEPFDLPAPDPVLFTAPLPDTAQYYPSVYEPDPEPRDDYLERFDALLLATRARFMAIREFADAGFSSTPELEA